MYKFIMSSISISSLNKHNSFELKSICKLFSDPEKIAKKKSEKRERSQVW